MATGRCVKCKFSNMILLTPHDGSVSGGGAVRHMQPWRDYVAKIAPRRHRRWPLVRAHPASQRSPSRSTNRALGEMGSQLFLEKCRRGFEPAQMIGLHEHD